LTALPIKCPFNGKLTEKMRLLGIEVGIGEEEIEQRGDASNRGRRGREKRVERFPLSVERFPMNVVRFEASGCVPWQAFESGIPAI
jgi:hypothetical protein